MPYQSSAAVALSRRVEPGYDSPQVSFPHSYKGNLNTRTESPMPSRDIRHAAIFVVPLVAGGLVFLSGCPGETPKPNVTTNTSSTNKDAHDDDDHDHDHDHHHHHAEKGPHGGALVAIGQDDAHVEIVLDADTGALKAYVLDGEAEKPVAIKQESLELVVTLGKKEGADDDKSGLPDDVVNVTLAAVSPDDDGKATEYEGQQDELKGTEKFDAVLTAIKIGDKPFNNVNFKYPEGNEDHHH
jgi:hypothetical protein